MPQWTDTSAEAEQVLREVCRRMPLEQKWRQLGAIYETAQLLHQAGLQARGINQGGRLETMTSSNENLRVVREVISVLDQLGIAYALGGSWASSLLGKMRFTHDADLTAEPFPGREGDFCSCFGPDYYVSQPAVQQAVRQRGSFPIFNTHNLTPLAPVLGGEGLGVRGAGSGPRKNPSPPTPLPPVRGRGEADRLSGFKVDLFIRKDRPFEQSLIGRRFAINLPDSGGQTIQCVSPEDLILLKLEWFRLGGEVAQQQLLDVRGVLEIQADRLDQAYLDRWSADLGIADLLAQVREESAL